MPFVLQGFRGRVGLIRNKNGFGKKKLKLRILNK